MLETVTEINGSEVRVGRRQFPVGREERDEAPIGRNFRAVGEDLCLPTLCADRYQLVGPLDKVSNENIRGAIRVAGNEVRGVTHEGHVATVG